MHQAITIVGRLTRDPETNELSNGKSVTNFTVAVNEGFGDKKTTEFFNCSAWDKLGKNLAQYNKKGAIVAVQCKMKTNKREDKTYTQLIAQNISFINSGNANEQGNQNNHGNNSFANQSNNQFYQGNQANDSFNISDDDFPF